MEKDFHGILYLNAQDDYMIDSIIISTILLVKRFILIDYLRARKKTPFNPINIRFIIKIQT